MQDLEKPNGSPLFDYEGEIAIVIGKLGRHIPEADALDYVAGYACYNDGSVRDYQLHSHMFTSGKNFPRSGSFGPWLVTPDEAGDPESFTLTTRLNGDVMQQMPYADLIYNFNEIISYVSEFTELHPGDVIVTGSAAGSALFSQPQRWLQDGDVIEIEVPSIGTLTNTVEMAEGINIAPKTRSDAREVFMEALAYARNR
jgi:2-keto-4-pentenoate hydratase/2-oxohepta-3-ene-1,7-dioic acid hydratase in catechol pathway